MGKRSRIFLVLLLLIVLAIILWQAARPRERVYQGKTAREWFRKAVQINARAQNGMFMPSPDIAKAFNALGTDAVPVLADNMKLAGSKWRNREVMVWHKLPHFLQKLIPEPLDTKTAAETAREIISALPLKLRREIGARALPTLLKRLEDDDSGLYTERGQILDFYILYSDPRPADEIILPFLYKAINHPDASLRREAIYGLLQYNAVTNKIPELTKLLDDPDAGVRRAVLETFSYTGPEAKIAVPRIEKMLTNSDPIIQRYSAYALWRIDRQTNVALVVVTNLELLRYDQQTVEILSRLGEAGKAGIPNLLVVANTTNNTVIALSSANGGPANNYNLWMEDVIRFACCRAVDRLDPTQDTAILPALIDMLDSPRAESLTCIDVLNLLAKMGPKAAPALPVVRKRLDSKDEQIRRLAEKAVKSIGGDGKPADTEK